MHFWSECGNLLVQASSTRDRRRRLAGQIIARADDDKPWGDLSVMRRRPFAIATNGRTNA